MKLRWVGTGGREDRCDVHVYIYIYTYIYMCVCVCYRPRQGCVGKRDPWVVDGNIRPRQPRIRKGKERKGKDKKRQYTANTTYHMLKPKMWVVGKRTWGHMSFVADTGVLWCPRHNMTVETEPSASRMISIFFSYLIP